MKSKKTFQTISHIRDWIEEEALCSFHIISHWSRIFPAMGHAWKIPYYSIGIFYLENEYAHQETPLLEARASWNWIYNKCNDDSMFLRNNLGRFHDLSRAVQKHFNRTKEGLKSFSNAELASFYREVWHVGHEQYSIAALSEGADVLQQEDYMSVLPPARQDIVLQIVQHMSLPAYRSIFDKERILFLQSVLSKSPTKGYEKLVQKYFWTQNTFREANSLDLNYFVKEGLSLKQKKSTSEIRSELEKLTSKVQRIRTMHRRLIRTHHLTRTAQTFFRTIQQLAILQDHRKVNMLKLVYIIDQVMREVALRRRVRLQDLRRYTIPELIALLLRGKKIIKRELARRRTSALIAHRSGNEIKETILFGKDARPIISFFEGLKKIVAHTDEFKGFPASLGKGVVVTGRVRIVYDPSRSKKFNTGDILVTGMTRPEFVPLMRKAGAIVTNEGGITTHAAIVSRELGIPCIIGTKIATQVLKDGDMVEVDANKGVVRILKKAQ